MKNELVQWIIRFIKGIFIGSGAILPGVSGGALAAVFGIYEEIIQFISNIKKEFKSKLLFFLPVGLGGLFGIIVLAYPIESLLRNHPVFILLFFMGCIFGTVPLLYRKAKFHGQKNWHIYLTAFTAIISFILLVSANTFLDIQVAQTPVTWIMVGFIFALGFIVPGLSPSNFLIYMNLYEPLTRGISRLDWMILLPVGLGALVCVIALSKLVNHLMNLYYTTIFHFILGIVIASTVIIFPSQNQWSQLSLYGLIFSVVLFIIGLLLGLWMGRLELKHKPEN
ncbi:DUF368 domain-containing protein [Marinilactibacillus sp. Marseille-P9653]|uniref:DUF368 domain-containing protein n=1 Tax=Marinilactibacillus sp. Marseille-P9653 TaxID=2866583 RepID=UPI001CE432C3|nr:DUF368 domain-containing protein [Marinilactibacillus sp. Marseille-P9653]